MYLGIGNINDEAYEIITIGHAALTPVPFNFLCFVARGAKVIDDFKNRISEPLVWHVAAVVELKREQHLVTSPLARHRLPCPSR